MFQINRRGFLKASGAAAATTLVCMDAHSQAKPVVNLQLGWLLSGNQMGEVCADQAAGGCRAGTFQKTAPIDEHRALLSAALRCARAVR